MKNPDIPIPIGPSVLHMDGVFKRNAARRLMLQGVTAHFHSGMMYVIHGGMGPAREMLGRVMIGQVPVDAGRIHRADPPAPFIGNNMGFHVGGPVLRGLEMRAVGYNLRLSHYVDAIAALMVNPDALRRQLPRINPVDKAIVLHASAMLLPCSYFVANGAPWPADPEIRERLADLIDETRRRAAIISINKKPNIAPNAPNREAVRFRGGELLFGLKKKAKPKAEAQV